MIQVIQADDPRVFDYSIFPQQSPMNMVYIQQNLSQFSDALSESGRAFMEHHRAIYEAIDHSEIARKARRVMRSVKGLFTPDSIVALETLEDLQNAQLQMQRYMMAMPDIRKLYFRNKCDGFRDTYVDMEPNRIGDDHYDYRKVMSGHVEVMDDGSWCARQYFDELHEGDRALDADERMLIRKTWDAMRLAIQQGQDPTNMFGGDLGV